MCKFGVEPNPAQELGTQTSVGSAPAAGNRTAEKRGTKVEPALLSGVGASSLPLPGKEQGQAQEAKQEKGLDKTGKKRTRADADRVNLTVQQAVNVINPAERNVTAALLDHTNYTIMTRASKRLKVEEQAGKTKAVEVGDHGASAMLLLQTTRNSPAAVTTAQGPFAGASSSSRAGEPSAPRATPAAGQQPAAAAANVEPDHDDLTDGEKGAVQALYKMRLHSDSLRSSSSPAG